MQKRIMLVKSIVDEHYQPQSHKGCLRDIWRNHVNKVYPMSEVTFYRYMRYAIGKDGYVGRGGNRVERERKEDTCTNDETPEQLKLF